ncbi:MAG: hypothetical protein ACQEXV_07540 [Bacillota bacterium]
MKTSGNFKNTLCDSVVVAIGAKSRSFENINAFCREYYIPCHVIGEAVQARRALNVVAEANEIARAIYAKKGAMENGVKAWVA